MRNIKLSKSYYIIPFLLSLFPLCNISALEYQSNTNIQFTLNPTISISVSDDLVIDNLSPGNASDSNVVNVNVATNNVTGYTLSATVGNSTTNPSNELRHSGYDGNNNNSNSNNYKFTSTSTDIAELTNLEPNTWGYNYSTDNGSNWHDYSTLPLYTNTGTTLNSTTTASNDNIKFKIGAKASSTQASGTYTNTINFYATTNQSPTTFQEAFATAHKEQYNGYYTMQDMNTDICKNSNVDIDSNIQLIDIRDNEIYTIAKLKDGNCWMLDNLRLDPTNPVTANNINADNTNAPINAIANYFNDNNPGIDGWSTKSVANIDIDFGSFKQPRINNSLTYDSVTIYGIGSGLVGVYYNFCAATVGTYCYPYEQGVDIEDTLIDAPHDICPINWRLPTNGNGGEYNNLYIAYNTTQDATNIASLQNNLSTPLSGYYLNNHATDINSWGNFHSSTYYDGSFMLYLTIRPSLIKAQNHDNQRDKGFSIRCLAK